jgi:hypothetical protein
MRYKNTEFYRSTEVQMKKKYLNLKSKYLNFAALKQNLSIKIF